MGFVLHGDNNFIFYDTDKCETTGIKLEENVKTHGMTNTVLPIGDKILLGYQNSTPYHVTLYIYRYEEKKLKVLNKTRFDRETLVDMKYINDNIVVAFSQKILLLDMNFKVIKKLSVHQYINCINTINSDEIMTGHLLNDVNIWSLKDDSKITFDQLFTQTYVHLTNIVVLSETILVTAAKTGRIFLWKKTNNKWSYEGFHMDKGDSKGEGNSSFSVLKMETLDENRCVMLIYIDEVYQIVILDIRESTKSTKFTKPRILLTEKERISISLSLNKKSLLICKGNMLTIFDVESEKTIIKNVALPDKNFKVKDITAIL